MDSTNATIARRCAPRTEGARRCREQRTLACVGLAAALRRLSRRKRLRAKALAALVDRFGRE